MKKSFKLEGLGCANCAAKIEKNLAKIKGVKEVTVSFLTSKINIEYENISDHILIEEVVKTVKKYESHVVVTPL